MKPVVRPELRYRRTWVMVGLLMLVTITVVCLMPSEALPQTSLSDKSEHTLAFAALSFWFGSIVARYDIPWLALLLVAFGGAIEWAQGAMGWGRSSDLRDLGADTLGVVLGIGLALTPLGRVVRWAEGKLSGIRG